jgi:hypothetical protein
MATKYWFKRKRYGYGWAPTTKEGWLTLWVYVGAIVAEATIFLGGAKPITNARALGFAISVIISLIVLLAISYKKGPRPKWRWGAQPTDNPEEDA